MIQCLFGGFPPWVGFPVCLCDGVQMSGRWMWNGGRVSLLMVSSCTSAEQKWYSYDSSLRLGSQGSLDSPQARRAYCAKHCQAMLSARFVGTAAWQTSGKGRSEEDGNCQARMDWERYVCVLAHAQNIDNNIFFQHAEPVVTVCQSLNFICYCLCLASLNPYPSLQGFHAYILVLLSICYCLLLSP